MFPSPNKMSLVSFRSEESREEGIGDSAWGQGISGHQRLGIVAGISERPRLGIVAGNHEHQRLGIVAGNHEHQQLGIVAGMRNRRSRIDIISAIMSNARKVLHKIRYRSDAV